MLLTLKDTLRTTESILIIVKTLVQSSAVKTERMQHQFPATDGNLI